MFRIRAAVLMPMLASVLVAGCSGALRSPARTAQPASRCSAGDLVGLSFGSHGVIGAEIVYLALRNVSSHSCLLEGWPDVRLLGANREPIKEPAAHTSHGLMGPVKPRLVTLRPGGRALFQLLIYYRLKAEQECPRAYFVRVKAPHTSKEMIVSIVPTSVCRKGKVTPVESDMDDVLGNTAVERTE